MRNATNQFEGMTAAACRMIGLGLGLQAASWHRADGQDQGPRPDLVFIEEGRIYAAICEALTPPEGQSVLDIDVADER
jgi:hypothetical protein